MPKFPPLNLPQLESAACKLAERIPQFQQIFKELGMPPLWDRENSFKTLIYIILEQQVSLSSARATYEKLIARLPDLSAQSFLTLNDTELKSVGFSRQKTRYCRIVAEEVVAGNLDFSELGKFTDGQVKEKLMSITGIGHWTSDIYLLMVLLRSDVWPHGDRALAVAAYEIFDLQDVPNYESLREMAESWAPWRSVAARFLWHYYLNTPRKRK